LSDSPKLLAEASSRHFIAHTAAASSDKAGISRISQHIDRPVCFAPVRMFAWEKLLRPEFQQKAAAAAGVVSFSQGHHDIINRKKAS
jgi:hypothetical protein